MSDPVVEPKQEEKPDETLASQATQEEQKQHDVTYADEETTAKVSVWLQQIYLLGWFRKANFLSAGGHCKGRD